MTNAKQYKLKQVSTNLVMRAIKQNKDERKQIEELYRPKIDINYIKSVSNIPKRYQDANFTPLNAKQEELIRVIRTNLKDSINKVSDLIIYGTVGTGKTHIAIGALNKLIEKGVYCKYATEAQLLEMYFRRDYIQFDNFKKTTLLIIDEVGKGDLAKWQQIQIEELVSYRYNEMLPTFFITNLSQKDFKKSMGDRVIDRLRDNKAIQFTLEGDSLRGKLKR